MLRKCVKNKGTEDITAAGIAYLESLEQKDPGVVMQVRKDIYQAEIDAQRDQLAGAREKSHKRFLSRAKGAQ